MASAPRSSRCTSVAAGGQRTSLQRGVEGERRRACSTRPPAAEPRSRRCAAAQVGQPAVARRPPPWGAGGPGGVDDVRRVVRRAPAARRRIGRCRVGPRLVHGDRTAAGSGTAEQRALVQHHQRPRSSASSISARRSAGRSRSIGRKAAPALSTARMATTRSGGRGRQTPPPLRRRRPAPVSRCASRFARASSSPYVSAWPPHSTATAAGCSAARRSNSSCRTRRRRPGAGSASTRRSAAGRSRVGQQRQLGDRPVGVGGDRAEQRHEVPAHPPRGGGVEQVGAVLQRPRQRPPARSSKPRTRSKPVLACGSRCCSTFSPLRSSRASGAFWSTTMTCEQRVPAGVPLGLDRVHHPLERHVLVREGVQHGALHRVSSSVNGAGSTWARSTRVFTKKPMTSLQAGVRARPRRGRRRCRTAPSSGPAAPGTAAISVMNRVAPHRRDSARSASATSAATSKDSTSPADVRDVGRGRSVGSSSGDSAGQLPRPVLQLPRQRVPRQPGALPDREVGVLERHRSEGGLPALPLGAVQLAQLLGRRRPSTSRR